MKPTPSTAWFAKRPRVSPALALASGFVALSLPLPLAHGAEAKPESAPPAAESSSPTQPPPETHAAEAADTVEAAPGDFRNWFDVTVGGLAIDGNAGAAQQRFSLPNSAFGGVSRFHFEQDVGKKGVFKIDGRGIFDNEDYGLRLEWSEPDKGFVRGGLSQFRDFSDATGGWFPGNNAWFQLPDDSLAVVRGSAFFEGGLRLPNLPEITVRYEHDWREGSAASTLWGDTMLTGGAGPRAIVPAFRGLDESANTISIDLRKTLGKVTVGGTFAYENSEFQNSTYLRRRPSEDADRHITHRESVESDLYSARAFADTIFNEKFRVTTSYAFTTLETDLGGSRIIGADYDAVYDPLYGRRDNGFLGLSGGSQMDQHVWNVNGMWTPIPHLAVIPAFRVENQDLDGNSSWTDTGAESLARSAANRRDMLDLSQQLEVRYTGVTNVVLYARGDWIEGDGNLLETQIQRTTDRTELHRDTDFDRFAQKYTAGTHWYPAKRLNVHAQYFRKIRQSRDDHSPTAEVNASGLYPAFLTDRDFVTDDFNVRVTWRPIDKLTLVSRYDLQLNTFESGSLATPSITTARGTAHILGETITWTPFSRLYLQPGVQYVLDATRSPAADSVPGGSPVEDARNNYFNVSCVAGLVLDDKTDFQTQYSFYFADNFNDISASSQPYGADAEEHGILATLIRRIHPRLRVTLRYGFFSSRDHLSGGFNDYNAHLVSTSAQYLF